MGLGTTVALIVLVVASGGLLFEAHRARREVGRLSASIERLGLVRRALDGLRAEAISTRTSTDLTADDFAHRGHR